MWGNGKKTLATLLSAIMIAGTILQTSAGAGENIKNKQRKVALDDVVVTAEKQEMQDKDIAGSISVVDSLVLDEHNIRTTEEMTRVVPNLFFKTATSGDAFVSRGISTIDTSLYSPMGFYINDVAYPLSYMQAQALFDIERIEVLRGPRSTLYGKNSSSGVINMVSTPQGNTARAHVLLEAGAYNTFTTGAMVGGPILEDTLFYTFSALRRVTDGYMENQFLGTDEASDGQSLSGQASLRYTPNSDLDITLTLDGSDQDKGLDDLRYLDGASATNQYKVLNNQVSSSEQKNLGQSLHVKYRFDNLDFISVTSHQDFDRNHIMDSDRTSSPLGVSCIDLDRESWAQELRLSSSSGGFFSSWLLGAYASNENIDHDWELKHAMPALANRRLSESDADGIALFGQASRPLTQRLTARAGLRVDHSSASGSQAYTRSTGTTLYAEDLSDTELLPMASLSWEFTPSTTGYLTFSTGWMAGGYDYYSATSRENFAYGPEYTRNYEGGIKTTFFNNRLRANLSIFHTDIDDKQIREEVLGGGIGAWKTTNAASAHTRGVELELKALPLHNLEIFAGLGYAKAEIDEWIGTLDGTAMDYSGYALPWAPDLTANAGISYNHESGWYGTAGIFLAGEQYFDAANTLRDDGYALVNLKAGYRWDRYDISIWCKNLFDEKYAQKKVKTQGNTLVEDGEPMTLGVTLNWRW
jgi:iron complex outermembrane receptor protein